MEKATYLDRLAEYGVQGAHPGGLDLTKRLLSRETITAGMTILDLGCGSGETSMYIKRRYPCKVVAADINPKMLENAGRMFAKNGLTIPLVQADAMELPFPSNSFEMVLVESVTVFTEIRRSLPEYLRVLKPGGILLEVEVTAISSLTGNEAKDLQSVLGFSWMPTGNEWEQLFREAGFNVVQVLGCQRINPIGTFLMGMNPAFRDYSRLMLQYWQKIGFGVYRCALN